jgi:hypothetical protein
MCVRICVKSQCQLVAAVPPVRPPARRICMYAKFAADTFLISPLRMSGPRARVIELGYYQCRANMIIGGAQSSAVIGCAQTATRDALDASRPSKNNVRADEPRTQISACLASELTTNHSQSECNSFFGLCFCSFLEY